MHNIMEAQMNEECMHKKAKGVDKIPAQLLQACPG